MSYQSWTSHCSSGNQRIEGRDMGAREKMSHPSLSGRPLLGPDLQDSRKAEPTCPWSSPLPRPCSCHSCRSTGLRGAGSDSQTPPQRSSGGPHRCHGAGCGQGTGSTSADQNPDLGHPSCSSLTPTHSKTDRGQAVGRGQSQGEAQKETRADLEIFADGRIPHQPGYRKKREDQLKTPKPGVVEAQQIIVEMDNVAKLHTNI